MGLICETLNIKEKDYSNQNDNSKRNKGENEVDTKHASSIPESVSDQLFNSIFRIEIGDNIGTGFFIKINEIKRFFMFTNYHVIDHKFIDSKALLSIYYGKKGYEIKKIFNLYKRFILCFDEPIDITIIEILKEDEIPESKFLLPDLNYKNGYKNYEKEDLYLAGYPNYKNYKNERQVSSGKINKIYEEFQFEHTLDTRRGSSGSPICLSGNLNVIGIHKSGSKKTNINYGTFLGKILDEIIDNIKKINEKENNKKNNTSKIDFREKIKNCVCKVHFQNIYSTGFFCLVPIIERSNLIPVLITSFNTFKDLKFYEKIEVSFNDNELRELYIDKNRKIYTSPNFYEVDIRIIELIPNDRINNFLELDQSFLIRNNKDDYLNKKVSLYYYDKGEYFTSSSGYIKNVKGNIIYHNCKTTFGSLGAPIISTETDRVIGIHQGFEKDLYVKRGLLIEEFVNDFINKKN